MAWTNICTNEFYKRYIRDHEEQFSEATVEAVRGSFRQSRLGEYAEAEA